MENQDALNPEEQPEALEPENTEEVVEESGEALKEKLQKAEELAKNQRIRAEKAERALKQKSALKTEKAEEVEAKSTSGMSLKDIRALQDVHDDCVDQVIEYAKFKGVSIVEAKKDPVMQTFLKTKEEERRIAEATNTGGARRGTNKISDETLIKNFNSGVPLKEDDIERLVEAQIAQKKSKAKGT